jgi:hypothetical protein
VLWLDGRSLHPVGPRDQSFRNSEWRQVEWLSLIWTTWPQLADHNSLGRV